MLRLAFSEEVRIEGHQKLILPGHLTLPENPAGVVLFAHGSGSSRLSPRNTQVAYLLNRRNLGTLLFDLLTEGESMDRDNVFDIPLLSVRLTWAATWISRLELTRQLPIGFFGASTGAAAALMAAADLKERVAAIVSRGGRPDLAKDRIPEVTAPTLLVVGGEDDAVIALNQEVAPLLKNANLVVVPGAGHLFEGPGELEMVARVAGDWFLTHFKTAYDLRLKRA